jgi:hypothetical protein
VTPLRIRLLWRLGTLVAICALLWYAVVYAWPGLVGNAVGSVAEERAEPCLPGHAVPLMHSPHVSPSAAAHLEYNSLPPTSGPHFSFAPALGEYGAPVADGLTVHALEHGHIAVLYATDTPEDGIDILRGLSNDYPRDVLLAPYPDLPHGIAVTAWGRLDTTADVDADRLRVFIEQLRGRYDHGWTGPPRCG